MEEHDQDDDKQTETKVLQKYSSKMPFFIIESQGIFVSIARDTFCCPS
jgi:hypothetical protein